MKIYTSYYAMMRKLDENLVPISIAGGAPSWYKGIEYKKVAPKYTWFMEWKQNHDNDFYVQKYNETVLSQLNPKDVLVDLERLGGGKDVVLLCYEKPSDFCHRHLVANWLNDHGCDVREIDFGGK